MSYDVKALKKELEEVRKQMNDVRKIRYSEDHKDHIQQIANTYQIQYEQALDILFDNGITEYATIDDVKLKNVKVLLWQAYFKTTPLGKTLYG